MTLAPFQVGSLVVLLVIFSVSVGVALRSRRPVSWLWAFAWFGAIVLMLFPDLTAVMAHVMGIKRGVDLVLYTFVLVTAVGFFFIYLRYKQLDRTMTCLVRQLAIRSVREPDPAVEDASLPSELEAHVVPERD